MGDHDSEADDQAPSRAWEHDSSGPKVGSILSAGRSTRAVPCVKFFYRIALGCLLLKVGGVRWYSRRVIGAPINLPQPSGRCTPCPAHDGRTGMRMICCTSLSHIRHHQPMLPVGARGGSIFIEGIPSLLLQKNESRAQPPGRPGPCRKPPSGDGKTAGQSLWDESFTCSMPHISPTTTRALPFP